MGVKCRCANKAGGKVQSLFMLVWQRAVQNAIRSKPGGLGRLKLQQENVTILLQEKGQMDVLFGYLEKSLAMFAEEERSAAWMLSFHGHELA